MYTDNELKNLSNYKMAIAMQTAVNERMIKQATKPSKSTVALTKVVDVARLLVSPKPA